MTLVRLRQGLLKEDLAFRMKVSQSTISRIVTTWISFLSRELSPPINWPAGEENKSYYPDYPNVKAFIDCTKVYIQHPSAAEGQALTYSNYKSTNTWKTLVSCTPAGLVSFISPGQGLASDRKIVENCGILDKFDGNDICIAD
ncbi:hypothetical protein pdam_00018006 [Pocillopora damicornis]|uniref:DDE Tnp4 domain-containing protein n=1 Tax=Pocillopora damicornis TaxID=46731 RepID=A0A3M6TF40_POCDA|nr:hypothetical protein pdam_00018006 [Pocillopora damicornis]